MSIESMASKIVNMETRLGGIIKLIENQGEIDLNSKYGVTLMVVLSSAKAALGLLEWEEDE